MYLYGLLESCLTTVKRCDAAFVPVPSAAPRRGARGTAYGTLRSRVAMESIGEHGRVVTGIGADHANVTSTLSGPYPVAESSIPFCSPEASDKHKKCCWTMHAFLAESYGCSLNSLLVEIDMMSLYGIPERHTTIVKSVAT